MAQPVIRQEPTKTWRTNAAVGGAIVVTAGIVGPIANAALSYLVPMTRSLSSEFSMIVALGATFIGLKRIIRHMPRADLDSIAFGTTVGLCIICALLPIARPVPAFGLGACAAAIMSGGQAVLKV